jgi:ABC-type uncharacterized transport system permease subunit
MRDLLSIFTTADFYSASLRLAAPLLFAALGGVVSERSGILNMYLEGQMLIGALFAFLGSYYLNSAVLGVLVAIFVTMLFSLIHGFMCIVARVNQVVAAVGFNTLAIGVTSTLFRFLFGVDLQMVTSPGFSTLPIPLLSKIPFIGEVLFNQNILTYLAVLVLLLINYFLYRTSYGLELRAAGENPLALDVAGKNVNVYRWFSILLTGALCGIAGACLTITNLNTFYDNITSGRGFIAYAAVVFGKWKPLGAALAVLLFGAGDALQLRMQALDFNVPYYFYLMMPYVITFVSLVVFMGPSRGPAASSVPYVKDKARKGRRWKKK